MHVYLPGADILLLFTSALVAVCVGVCVVLKYLQIICKVSSMPSVDTNMLHTLH